MTATPPPLPTAPARENPRPLLNLWLTVFSAVFAALFVQFLLFLACFNIERSVERGVRADRYKADDERRELDKLLKRVGVER